MDFATSYFTPSLIGSCSNVGLACRVGDATGLDSLIKGGCPIDVRDNRGWYPVHEAAFSDHHECIKLLGKCNDAARIFNGQAYDGTTALILACQKGHFKSAQQLLLHGADPNLGSADHMYPLMASLQHRSIELVDLLLEHGADPKLPYWNNWTVLHDAACYGFVAALRKLHDHGADLFARDDDGLTCLFVAVQYGRLDALMELIKLCPGAPEIHDFVNTSTNDGATPVYIAAQEGYDKILEVLVDYGADVDQVTTEDLVHPVVPAVRHNHWRSLQVILAHSDINAINESAEDPVMQAVERNSTECLQLLIDAGLPLERQSRETHNIVTSFEYLKPLFHRPNVTPLGRAVMKGREDMVPILLRSGAQLVYTTSDCFSPLVISVYKRQQPDLLRLFLAFSADAHAISDNSLYNVPDTVMAALHPLFISQLVVLLKAGVSPRVNHWCACNNSTSHSLIDELCSLFTQQDVVKLCSLLIHFVPQLPNCCQSWRQITAELESVNVSSTPTLTHLSRLAVLHNIPASRLIKQDCLDQLIVPDSVRQYLLFSGI